MEIHGKIKLINETQTVSGSFKKRELVVTTDEQYPQHISIEFQQDKTDLLNSYAVGESVKVSINLRGRCWVNPHGEEKHFNTIVGWRIEKQNQTPISAVDQYLAKSTVESFTGTVTSDGLVANSITIVPNEEDDLDLLF
jgi:hypothetical protein